jgi:hypothetical protein
MILTLFV